MRRGRCDWLSCCVRDVELIGAGGGASGVSGRGNRVGSGGDSPYSGLPSDIVTAVGGPIGRSVSGIGGTEAT